MVGKLSASFLSPSELRKTEPHRLVIPRLNSLLAGNARVPGRAHVDGTVSVHLAALPYVSLLLGKPRLFTGAYLGCLALWRRVALCLGLSPDRNRPASSAPFLISLKFPITITIQSCLT